MKTNNMELQIVSKEIALELKQLGFDWKVLSHYCQEGKLYDNDVLLWTANLEQGIDIDNFCLDCNSMKNDEIRDDINIVSAPTQALVIKWFRDVHKITIRIDWSLEEGNGYAWVKWLEENKENLYSGFSLCNEYEQVEELGILKAIQILKERNDIKRKTTTMD